MSTVYLFHTVCLHTHYILLASLLLSFTLFSFYSPNTRMSAEPLPRSLPKHARAAGSPYSATCPTIDC
ncbi:hypothetical protein BDV59DRAFT_189675 [Aspergillus ambiguus]|uniref:uncharacterized protein n=1 Tax=Aspergillus ambiguus TaxID=176160 RepID=UPI003CCD9B41